jgi:hypothetical protein
MEEDSKFYLFKALGFNVAKGKFDTKGCNITGISDPDHVDDTISFGFLKKQLEPISSSVKKLNETQSQFKNDIKELEIKIHNNNRKRETDSVTRNSNTSTPALPSNTNFINELEKLNNSVIKEVVYEITTKRSSIGAFSLPKRLLDSLANRNSVAGINIYSSIDLMTVAARLVFINHNNRELHGPELRNKKHLKEPLTIVIKNRKDSSSSESNLYNLSTNSIQIISPVKQHVSLDNKFLERVRVEPDNLSKCFLSSPSERSLYPNVREITDAVENINLVILFVIRLNYKAASNNDQSEDDDD